MTLDDIIDGGRVGDNSGEANNFVLIKPEFALGNEKYDGMDGSGLGALTVSGSVKLYSS